MEVGTRPAQLSGCWKTWSEKDVDVVLRTNMESGAVHTRRRFTGRSRVVTASVTLDAALYEDFETWFMVNQQQGAVPTYVVPPYGGEEIFQFMAPPTYAWGGANNKVFTATVQMWQASYFQ
jgi:hypothetical protein